MLEGPRAARPDELAAVVDLANAAFSDERPSDMGRWFPTLYHPDNCGRIRVILDRGRPVSMAGFTVDLVHAAGVSFTAACIGSVCTLEGYRGRGLATAIMADCVERCRKEGVAVLLISGGRGLYRRMGCIDAGSYCTVQVPRGAALPRMDLEAREWREQDVAGMAALQRREPVRFERSPDRFHAFLGTGLICVRKSRTWVVARRGEPTPLAYLGVQEPVETPKGRAASAREIGGSRAAVLAASPLLMAQCGAERIDIDCLGCDIELAALAVQHGLEVAPRSFQGTVRALSAAAVVPLVEQRARAIQDAGAADELLISATNNGLEFRLAGEAHLVGDLPDLTALLFGSPEREPPLPGPGPLRGALELLFPIPLVDYGFNYI